MVVRQSVLVVAVIVALGHAARADAQVTLTYEANPASLGAIPGNQPGTSFGCGSPRDVTFAVSAAQAVVTSTVAVSLAVSGTAAYALIVDLIDPGGVALPIFARTASPGVGGGAFARLSGVYGFSDSASGNWWQAGLAATNGVMPSGGYRASAVGGAVTAMNLAFGGRPTQGLWTLRVRNCWSLGGQGTVSASTLTITGAPVATATAAPSTLGAIPDGPTLGAQTPGAPRDVTFAIPPGRGRVRKVRLSTTIAHASVGDVVARLMAPSGESHVLFGYTGANNTGYGFSSELAGTYEFQDGAPLDWWAVAEVDDPVVPGVYSTSALGGPGSTGAVTSMDAAFADVPSNGVWTLRLTDGAAGQVGAISAASLTLESDAIPSTFADSYSTAYSVPLTIAAPGVLANDTENLGGALSAQLVSGPTNGTLSLASTGAFTYAPAPGFAGTDTFTYRATNSAGPGNMATVSIAVAAPTFVQPPTMLRTSSMGGNRVTLRWTPPAIGPAATDFVIEGGVAPGQVLGAVRVGGPLPILTATLPTGAFFLRVRAVDAMGLRSGPSNEIPIFVNTAATPSAPATPTGVVNGNAFALSWRNTFAGGAPTSLQLNVSGSAVATVPLPLGETFSFAGVPAGTYTFRLREVNATGASLDSLPVTLTFPNGCTGAPVPPPNFLAYVVGNVVHLTWDPPDTGAAAASYLLHVGGAYSGTFPLASRNFTAPAPAGAYALSVSAKNACGTSAPTAAQTVFVP